MYFDFNFYLLLFSPPLQLSAALLLFASLGIDYNLCHRRCRGGGRRGKKPTPWAISIQQKFRFEIWEISRAERNGTLRLLRPDPSHRVICYSCKHDPKEWYRGQQFCEMERDISVRLTDQYDQTDQSGPPLNLVPNILVRPNRNDPFHLMYQPKFPEFGVEWKAPLIFP